MNQLESILEDRGFWVTVLTMVLPPLSQRLGIQLSPQAISAILVAGVGYVFAHRGHLLMSAWNDGKAAAEKKVLDAVTDPPKAP